MTDREKVIKGLECCTAELEINQHRDDFCVVCPYKDKAMENWYCFHKPDLMRDALALLKAQEPVEPKMMYFVDEGLTWETYEVPTCGVCGALLGDALFCPMCGRAVKRND